MTRYELVLRRHGEEDEVISMLYDGSLYADTEFFREGVRWVVTKDDGPPQRFRADEHVARLICDPKPPA